MRPFLNYCKSLSFASVFIWLHHSLYIRYSRHPWRTVIFSYLIHKTVVAFNVEAYGNHFYRQCKWLKHTIGITFSPKELISTRAKRWLLVYDSFLKILSFDPYQFYLEKVFNFAQHFANKFCKINTIIGVSCCEMGKVVSHG